MTHSKQPYIMEIDRFKRKTRIVAHISLLFLVAISTCKTPVFAQDSIQNPIQEACTNTKISLPIFIPLKNLRTTVENAVPPRFTGKGSLDKSSNTPKIQASWDIGRLEIQLSENDGQLLAATKFGGVLRGVTDTGDAGRSAGRAAGRATGGFFGDIVGVVGKVITEVGDIVGGPGKIVSEAGKLVSEAGKLASKAGEVVGGVVGGVTGELGLVTISKVIGKETISAHTDVLGEAKIWIEPKFEEDWGIKPNFRRDVSITKADVLGGRITVKGIVNDAINDVLEDNISSLSSYLKSEEGLKKYLQESWSALNIVQKLSQDPPIWLVVTPRAFATTQPRIASTGIYLHFVAEAETDLKIGTTPKRSIARSQLPSTLRILDTSERGSLDVAMPISIDFVTFNSLIEAHLKKEPVEKTFGTIKLNEIVLASSDRGSFTMKTVISLAPAGWLKRLWYWITGKEIGTQDIVLSGKPTLSPGGKQVTFKNVNLSDKSSQLILKLAKIYKGLTGKLVEDLIQDNVSANLDSRITKAERDLQVKIDHYAKKLQEEKNITMTAKILPKTRLASIDTNGHSFLIKACAAATLAIKEISLDDF